MSNGEVILYTSHDGTITLKLKMLENTVWLTQSDIAELFGKGRSTIAEHISAIFDDGELESISVCRKFRQTADDGKFYDVIHYNLDLILAVGYRTRSPRGIQFRERANPELPNMGLTSWKGSRVRQQDVTIAKNYLDQPEIEELNRIVVMYLDHAEDQARRRKAMNMAEWEEKLDAFLIFKERDLLDHAGKISAQVAEKLALERYEAFDGKRRKVEKQIADDEDRAVLKELQAISQSAEALTKNI